MDVSISRESEKVRADFREVYDSILPTSRTEENAIIRRFLLRGSLAFVEERFIDGTREIVAINWRRGDPKCVWQPVSVR